MRLRSWTAESTMASLAYSRSRSLASPNSLASRSTSARAVLAQHEIGEDDYEGDGGTPSHEAPRRFEHRRLGRQHCKPDDCAHGNDEDGASPGQVNDALGNQRHQEHRGQSTAD